MPRQDGGPSNYRRTEVLPQLVLVPIAAVGALIAALGQPGMSWPLIATIAAIALVMPFFAVLTIVIEDGRLEVRFGLPIFRRAFDLKEIIAARSFPNVQIHAWGVRRIRPWLFGQFFRYGAVDIELRDGTAWRIGTRDPEGLVAALRKAGVPGGR